MKDKTQAAYGSIGGHLSWANTVDRTARTQPGRDRFMAKFYEDVPAEITDPEQRRKAAENLMRAHFKRMALRSAQARKRAS